MSAPDCCMICGCLGSDLCSQCSSRVSSGKGVGSTAKQAFWDWMEKPITPKPKANPQTDLVTLFQSLEPFEINIVPAKKD